MQIILNGQTRPIAAGATVATLLEELGLAAKPVAVELNLAVVPRAGYSEQELADGDQLELVTLVGGG